MTKHASYQTVMFLGMINNGASRNKAAQGADHSLRLNLERVYGAAMTRTQTSETQQ